MCSRSSSYASLTVVPEPVLLLDGTPVYHPLVRCHAIFSVEFGSDCVEKTEIFEKIKKSTVLE